MGGKILVGYLIGFTCLSAGTAFMMLGRVIRPQPGVELATMLKPEVVMGLGASVAAVGAIVTLVAWLKARQTKD